MLILIYVFSNNSSNNTDNIQDIYLFLNAMCNIDGTTFLIVFVLFILISIYIIGIFCVKFMAKKGEQKDVSKPVISRRDLEYYIKMQGLTSGNQTLEKKKADREIVGALILAIVALIIYVAYII